MVFCIFELLLTFSPETPKPIGDPFLTYFDFGNLGLLAGAVRP